MDNFQTVREQIRAYLAAAIILENGILLGLLWLAGQHSRLPLLDLFIGASGVSITLSLLVAALGTRLAVSPLHAIWQAIVHIAPHEQQVAAPDLRKLMVGRHLVETLAAQVYQIVSVAEHVSSQSAKPSPATAGLHANFIATNLPLPLFILNHDQTIIFANANAAKYVGLEAGEIEGKNVHDVLTMSFPNEHTFDAWFQQVGAASVIASNTWERVRLDVTDRRPARLFDLAVYYNTGNSQGYELMLVLFDHTKQYSQDDQAISFMALSVHELRTPLTLLRGYIEAFDEDTRGKLSPELDDFMAKMKATAQQLAAFVNNILNVAQVESDQLVLQLHEENWADIMRAAVAMMELRAKVRGITLTVTIAPDLPPVAADRISIQEVISNLIDNAIKYSGSSKEIVVSSRLNSDGMVETSVQDFGVGVPLPVMPNLFTKFYRDHRNRAQVGGTGLGLYLSKAIVAAHSGNIWVKSKEGEGSTFSFTLLPYAMLAEEARNSDNKEIVRSAHGWIKNHSLYRR